MSELEQRIAIAEACGWTRHSGKLNKNVCDNAFWRDGGGCAHEEPPDYLHDLNAMHEAESTLEGMAVDTRSMYYDYLLLMNAELFEKTRNGMKRDPFDRDWAIIRATAAQRAEAFLRTLGRWKE